MKIEDRFADLIDAHLCERPVAGAMWVDRLIAQIVIYPGVERFGIGSFHETIDDFLQSSLIKLSEIFWKFIQGGLDSWFLIFEISGDDVLETG